MATDQGYDTAAYSCGRCAHQFTAHTEDAYVRQFAEHMGWHAQRDLTVGPTVAAIMRTVADHISDLLINRPDLTAHEVIRRLRTSADTLERTRRG